MDNDPTRLKALIENGKEAREDLASSLLEIDRRKLWWEMGYSSLYNYCQLKLKLSPEEVDEILDEDGAS